MTFNNPLSEREAAAKLLDPCILVIFGATGDLTARKLVPALYNLFREGQLPANFACVGFARRPKDHDRFRSEMRDAVSKYSRTKPLDEELWKSFSQKLFYHMANFDDDAGYQSLSAALNDLDQQLGTKGNRVYYLATKPTFFAAVIEKLKLHGLVYDYKQTVGKWSRVIIEKPFGRDYDSAEDLQRRIRLCLAEEQIYRIDHYLGKETVQNILVFRFANLIFEPLWNNKHIDHVQVTVGEEIGIGTRGKLWEEQGMLRDIIQNHMMQLLSLVAMEPPVSLRADSVRDEKVKVIEAIRPIDPAHFDERVVRGQYGPGYVAGEAVKGYREEQDVPPDSTVETYVALQVFIDNWRWAGVPFFLRAGKRLPKRATEIAITFRDLPAILFQQQRKPPETNVLIIRIQPDDGICLCINCKVPGLTGPIIQPVKMDFRYGSYFGFSPPEAYERLICDCIAGDGTLFARGDEVLASWRLLTPVLQRWAAEPARDFPNYQAGTWGPRAADELLFRTRRAWRYT
jgi:glucose-6-phosphate 1-dehydrogenase